VYFIPSRTTSSAITIAAAESSHQIPNPIPITPTAAAEAVIQSARFISASATRTLSWSFSASGFFIRPRITGGIPV
jgi:hypothetical protein